MRGACHHDCPDTCAWEVTVSNGVAVSLRGDPSQPFTDGQLCPKVNPFLDRVYHPDRLLTPLRRIGAKGEGRFEPISWAAAISEIAEQLVDAVALHGGETVLPYSLDGTQGLIQKGVMADRFFAALGATQLNRHICGTTAWYGAADVLGLPLGTDPAEIASARTVVLWGTNTLLTNRHLWPYIETARSNGAAVIVVDPVRTMTATRADWHVQPRPGTDVALVLGVLAAMDRAGLIDEDRLTNTTQGWPELLADAQALGPSGAAAITGIDSADIERLARCIASDQPVALRVLIGMEHREHGRDIHRSVAALAVVSGAQGGFMRSTQAYFDIAFADITPSRGPQRELNMSALGAALDSRMLNPPITALMVYGCNPAAITPDQNRVIAGLERDDLFTVVIEQFMTDTARYADIVLPTTTQIEHLDLMNAWGHLYVSLNLPAIEPLGECLPNTEIFRLLARAMNLDAPGLDDSDIDMVRGLLSSGHQWLEGIDYEQLQRDGWARLAVQPGWSALTDREVPMAPNPATGTDAHRPLGPIRLGSLRYRIASESPDGDTELADRYPLALMSLKQHQRFLNSHYGGFDHHLPDPPRPRLEISQADASERGIADGDEVRVFNDRGELFIEATISRRLQKGLVAIPFGWWAGDADARTVNVLTNPAVGGPDQLIGSGAFHDTLVEVELAAPSSTAGVPAPDTTTASS